MVSRLNQYFLRPCDVRKVRKAGEKKRKVSEENQDSQ